jgi:UDP-N-acetylglucosamine diphosphorylase / glucose-1-phosphate thymidylyltransferase / UDP-N-acetylgalactosamine diphosphorylase / glucosamine-1-phosphate N-acetyltransferase / galactosamine-1-phosphate N-acetyltransferase
VIAMLEQFVASVFEEFLVLNNFDLPWLMTESTFEFVRAAIPSLGSECRIEGELAVHQSANLEPIAIIRGPAIIGLGSSVGVNA